MTTAALPLEGPAPELRFKRNLSLTSNAREIWQKRELVRTLAERDYPVRYKQAVLGVAWAVVTPVALMLVFTLVFQHIAHVKHGGSDYALFAYLGLLPWTFFSSSLNVGGTSLVNNVPVLNKVYCPREVFPLASMATAALDTIMALTGLVVLFVVFQEYPQPMSVLLPLLIAVQVIFTMGLTLLASITIVYLRDVRYALPVFLQLGLFATPVAYGLEQVPEGIRPFYVALNPLAAVIDGYRRTVLENQPPQWGYLGLASITACITFAIGYTVFKRLEGGIADVA